MNFGNFAMLASIIASLVAVPVASSNITGDFAAAGAELMGTSQEQAETVPRQISESISGDRMVKEVETAMGTARFESTGDTFVSELETPEYSVTSTRQPDGTVEEYRSPSVTLEVAEGPGEIASTCETPNGVLETTKETGSRSTDFAGTHRQQVESRCSDARDRLEQGLEKLARISVDVGLVDTEVEIATVRAEKEETVISNEGPLTVSLANWTLEDEAGATFVFHDTELEPGESVTVHSDEYCPDTGVCWDEVNVWNNGGDTATLTNAQGETTDSYSYGE